MADQETESAPEREAFVREFQQAYYRRGVQTNETGLVASAHVAADLLAAARAEWDDDRTCGCGYGLTCQECQLAAVGAARAEALREAKCDIKARIKTFSNLGADPQYVNALHDAWGLVANRERATYPPVLPGKAANDE